MGGRKTPLCFYVSIGGFTRKKVHHDNIMLTFCNTFKTNMLHFRDNTSTKKLYQKQVTENTTM